MIQSHELMGSHSTRKGIDYENHRTFVTMELRGTKSHPHFYDYMLPNEWPPKNS